MRSEKLLPIPSDNEVDRYLQLWSALDNYREQEASLSTLFNKHSGNSQEEKSYVLLKVVALNHFYSTNIFNVYSVANRIVSIKDFDKKLKRGDLLLVSELRDKDKNGTGRDLYSFATKYCSHHNENDFPIYDNYVHRVLDYFNSRFDFMQDKHLTRCNKNEKDAAEKIDVPLRRSYEEFNLVINRFIEYFELQKFSIKQIDQYLWQLGKDWFPNYYQMNDKKKKELKEITEAEKIHRRFYVELRNPDQVVYEPSNDSREISLERASLMRYRNKLEN